MSSILWPNGLGEVLGDSLVTSKPLQASGQIYYVHKSGSDAYAGKDRAKPFATLAHAATVITNGDTIVCLDGHTETLAASVAFASAGVTVVGAGKSNGKPTVQFTPNTANNVPFNVTGNAFSLRNIWVKSSSAATNKCAVQISNAGNALGALVKDCYFELGANDTGGILLGTKADYARIQGTTLVSVATSVTAQPVLAIQVNEVNGLTGVVMEDVIFDAGADGFSNFWAFDSNSGAGMTGFRFERVTLLNGADMRMKSTDSGILSATTAFTGSRIDW